jgi:hypothetical protein
LALLTGEKDPVNYEIDSEEDEEGLDMIESSAEFQRIQLKQISVGNTLSCGITYHGQHLICWGETITERKSGNKYPNFVKGSFRQISVGGHGVCALRDADERSNLQCWGVANMSLPTSIIAEWDQVAVGDYVSCGVTMDSELRCWGRNFAEKLPSSLIVA